MRTSTTATSGLCAPTLRSRSSASPASPATSKPDSSSSRARPSRSSTESSASTTRSGALIRGTLLLSEELVDTGAGKLCLGHEAAGAGARDERAEVGRVAARHEHDVGPVAVGQLPGDLEAVDVGQLGVEEDEVGSEALGLGDARRAVSGFADDVEPLGLEQNAGARTEGGVVIDDEDGQRHREAIVNADNPISYTAGQTPARA